jgi:hypothetical protein
MKAMNIKQLLAGLVFLLFTVSSCSDAILKEKPLDFLSPENAYATESGVVQGITALHQRVRLVYYTYTVFGTMNWATHGSDVGYNGETPDRGSRYLNSYRDLTPTYTPAVDHWIEGFLIIQWANLLIDKTEDLDASVFAGGEAGKNACLAEARFFRAFIYRNLVSTYGDIPLMNSPVSSARADFVRDPVSEIHKLMEADFKFAATHLPKPGEEDAPGRITQGPAWHYLAETYLEMNNPQEAVNAATHVINDYRYALMTERFGNRLAKDILGSGDVWFDLFGYTNHNLPNNTEAMWVIQCERGVTDQTTINSSYIYGPRYFDITVAPDGKKAINGTWYNNAWTGISDTLSRPCGNARGTNLMHYYLWADDWDNDIRNAEHNIKRNVYYDNPESEYYGQKIDFKLYEGTAYPRTNPLDDTVRLLFPVFMKFHDPCNYTVNLPRAGGGSTHKDWDAVRFAETLLLRAEAYLGINRADLAAADVNLVRARANARPVSASDVDIDYVLDERARELYGEEWRLIVLRRTGKLVERVRKYNDNPFCPGAHIEEHNVRWPIPQTQIDLNIDAEFRQNPGY